MRAFRPGFFLRDDPVGAHAELLAAFSGNEMVLGIVLGLWMLLMGAGAWLGGHAARLRCPTDALAVLLGGTAILPPVQVFLLRALRNVIFVRGAEVGVTQTLGPLSSSCSRIAWRQAAL